MVTDISVAKSRIADLETRQSLLNTAIADILKDKRKIDKHHMELEEAITGKNVSDEQAKMKHKNEEKKMRIQYQMKVQRLKSDFVILLDQTADEENKSKDQLEKKQNLEEEQLKLNEELKKLEQNVSENRTELIKLRTKNSQLDSQQEMLDKEEILLKEANDLIILDNEDKKKTHDKLRSQISMTI